MRAEKKAIGRKKGKTVDAMTEKFYKLNTPFPQRATMSMMENAKQFMSRASGARQGKIIAALYQPTSKRNRLV